MRKLIIGLISLAILVGIAYRVWQLWRVPPCPSPVEVALRIKQDPAAQQCADIAVEMNRCVVRLDGRIESPEQLARVRGLVQGLHGITYVNDTSVRIVEAPFCEMMDLIEPLQKHAEARNFGLQVRLGGKEEKKPIVYVQNEQFLIEVTTPQAFESFIYVDYYANDGQVYHLFPNLSEILNFFPPSSVYTVGKKNPLKVQPPFGREYLAVIVTKQPLIFMPREPRYSPEPAGAYLRALRQALPRELAQAEIAAMFYAIDTRRSNTDTP